MSSYRDTSAAPGRRIAVVAHRGDWSEAPENSLAAIEAARRRGCMVAEIDIRRTADGALVLMHDDSTLRTTGAALVPEQTPLAALRALTLYRGDGSGRVPGDARIPTLAEALEIAGAGIFLDLDLKDRALAPEVIAAVRVAGATDRVDLKFAVETPEDCRRLAALQNESGIAMMAMARFTAQTGAARLAALEAAPPFMVEASFDSLETLALVAPRLAAAGTVLWVNTLDCAHCCGLSDSAALRDPEAVWGRLAGIGVTAIQTDQSAALLRWLAAREVETCA